MKEIGKLIVAWTSCAFDVTHGGTTLSNAGLSSTLTDAITLVQPYQNVRYLW